MCCEDCPNVAHLECTKLDNIPEVWRCDDFCGGSKNGGKLNGFWLYCPAYRALPETFEVTVSWRGDTVTFTMHKSDFEETFVDVPEYKTLLGF